MANPEQHNFPLETDPTLFDNNFGDWLQEHGVKFTGDWNTEHGGFDATIDLNQLKIGIILLIEAKKAQAEQ